MHHVKFVHAAWLLFCRNALAVWLCEFCSQLVIFVQHRGICSVFVVAGANTQTSMGHNVSNYITCCFSHCVRYLLPLLTCLFQHHNSYS